MKQEPVKAAVGVVGLGRMGTGMAKRLLRAGVPVTVWGRDPERASPLTALGATAAACPEAAARDQQLVLVSLADWASHQEVLFGPAGVLGSGPLAGVLAVTSTLAPDEVAQLAPHTPAVLDIGLQGNHDHATQGRLRLYVGGEEEVLGRVRPVLDLLAQEVRYVGSLGSGMRLKLVMNLLMGIEVQAMAEAVALGTGIGLDRRVVLDAITNSGFASPVMGFKARRMASGDYTAADFRLRLMAKDLRLARAAGERAGVELPLVAAAEYTHDSGIEQGFGDLDCAAVCRVLVGVGARADVTKADVTKVGGE